MDYTFKDFLIEISQEPVQVVWRKEGKELFGEFFVKEQVFTIAVTLLDNDLVDIYQFKFYRGDKETSMINDGKYVYGVIPTIKYALDYAVKELSPPILVFASSDKSTSRKAMYKLEAGSMATKYKYHDITRSETLKELGFDSDIVFGIYKTEEILQLALKDAL